MEDPKSTSRGREGKSSSQSSKKFGLFYSHERGG